MIKSNIEALTSGWTRNEIASKIANDLPHGSYVNLGIGMPELVSQFVEKNKEIIYHSENGLLGMGPPAVENEISSAPDRYIPVSVSPSKLIVGVPGVSVFEN